MLSGERDLANRPAHSTTRPLAGCCHDSENIILAVSGVKNASHFTGQGKPVVSSASEVQLKCKTQIGHQRRTMSELLCAKINNIWLAQILKGDAFNRDKIFAF